MPVWFGALTFAVESKQVDEWAVCRAEGRLILLRSQWFEVGQVGGAGGRDDRWLGAPFGWGWRRGLVISSHVTASPATEAKKSDKHVWPISWHGVRTLNQTVTSLSTTAFRCPFSHSQHGDSFIQPAHIETTCHSQHLTTTQSEH